MARNVKDPEERKPELLDTAMRLFAERGFSEGEMRAILGAWFNEVSWSKVEPRACLVRASKSAS